MSKCTLLAALIASVLTAGIMARPRLAHSQTDPRTAYLGRWSGRFEYDFPFCAGVVGQHRTIPDPLTFVITAQPGASGLRIERVLSAHDPACTTMAAVSDTGAVSTHAQACIAESPGRPESGQFELHVVAQGLSVTYLGISNGRDDVGQPLSCRFTIQGLLRRTSSSAL